MVGTIMPTAIGGHAHGQRVWPFLLASVALHALLVTTLKQRSGGAATFPDPSPLTVDFARPPAFTPYLPASPAAVPIAPPSHTSPALAAPAPAESGALPRVPGRAAEPDSAHPADGAMPDATVDLNAIRAQAREFGRASAPPQPRTGATSAPSNDTLAVAIARAYRNNNVLVERQENGGWVIRDGKRRCVIAPRDVPYFMQGMLIAPVCDS